MKIQSYKIDNKTLYRFCLYAGIDPVTGKQKQIRRSGFTTRQAAELSYAKLKVSDGPGSTKDYLFKDVCDLWLSDYEHTVSGSTYLRTNGIVEHHIKPFFGESKVDKITIRHAQDFANKMYKEYVKGHTFVSTAKRIVEYARVTLKAVNENPFNDIMLPKRKKSGREITYYTKDELLEFLSCCKESLPPLWHLFFHVLSYTGMRRGEALALTWKDIDFEEKIISINKTISRDKNGTTGVHPTKTASGKRTIDIDNVTTGLLESWRKENLDDLYVFTNTKGSYITFSQPIRQLQRVTEIHGLKYVSPHGLRHTHCSMLFAAQVPIPMVKTRLGHKDIKTTLNIYTHVYKEDEREAVEKFMKYIS